MSDIQRALDKQARLDAQATAGPWVNEGWHISGYVPGCRPNGEVLAQCFIRAGAHTSHALDESNAALIAHLRNQAQLARDVIAAAATRHDVEWGTSMVGQKRLDSALQAWAGHVNGDGK